MSLIERVVYRGKRKGRMALYAVPFVVASVLMLPMIAGAIISDKLMPLCMRLREWSKQKAAVEEVAS